MARTTPVHSGYTIINGAGTGPNGDRIDVWIEYLVHSQNVELNRSRVIAFFYAALRPGKSSDTWGSSGCYSSFSVGGYAGADTKNNGPYDFRTTTPNLMGTFDRLIYHNEDGTKTISMSGSFTTKSSWITGGSVSGNVTLPTINRGLVRVRAGGAWRTGLAYVRVGGVWRLGQVFVRAGGAWHRGI
jgi:hypothetical protein